MDVFFLYYFKYIEITVGYIKFLLLACTVLYEAYVATIKKEEWI